MEGVSDVDRHGVRRRRHVCNSITVAESSLVPGLHPANAVPTRQGLGVVGVFQVESCA
jgi:hypothetical protein